jgi:hypothetical protein
MIREREIFLRRCSSIERAAFIERATAGDPA